jgi:autotransporter-associated beta strand protein
MLTNWSTDPATPTPNPTAAPGGSDDLFFNISSANVNTVIELNAARAAESLNFTSQGTTQFRGNTAGTTARVLTVSPRGITMAPGAGAVTIGSGSGNVNLSFSSSQSITNNSSSTLSINNNVQGSNNPTITNNGTGANYVGMGALQATVGKVVQNSETSTLGLRNNNASFAGDLEILKGKVSIGTNANNLGSAASGRVVLGGSGTAAATIDINDNQNVTYAARPIVLGSTAGTLKIVLRDEGGASYTHTMTGAISGPNSLTLESQASGTAKDDKLVFTTGGFNNAGTITHIGDSEGDLTISSVIGPLVTGVIQNSPTSRLVLSGSNTYAGNTTVSAGSLAIESAASLPGLNTAGRYVVASGAVLAVTNAVADADVAAILGTGNIASGGAIGFDTTAGNRTYAAAIADPPAGGLGLVKLGTNTLALAGVNTYTGTTRVSQGTLTIATAAALPGFDTTGRFSVASAAVLAVGNAVTDADVAAILATGTGNFASGAAIGFDTSSGDRTYSAPIASLPIGLVKLGGNTLTLSGSNAFTGTTRSAAGTLAVADAFALGGSTLDMNAADSGSVTFGQDSTLGGLTGTRNIDLGGRTISIGANSQSTTYSGGLSNGSLTKTGTGTLALTGTNSYAGTTTVSAGILGIAGTAALPGWNTPGRYSVAANAVLSVENAITDADVTTILATGNFASGGVIGFDTSAGDRTAPALPGDIGLRKTGSNTLLLAPTGNTYSGPTTVAAGTLRIPGTQTIGSNVRAEAGAQLHLDGDVTMTGPVYWRGDGGLQSLSGTSEISGPMTLGNINGNILRVSEGAALTISGNVAAEGTASRFFVSGSGELIVTGNIGQLNTSNAGGMQGPATVHLLGLNSFTGQFNIGQGTVVVNTLYNTGFESSLGIGTGTNGIITNMAGGNTGEATLRYIGEETATNRQVRFQSNVAGARSVIEASGAGKLTFLNAAFNAPDSTSTRAAQTLVLAGTNVGQIEGRIVNNSATSVISLVKEGPGTWTLKDPTTFTGNTTISAGTLAAAAPGALETSPRVTVAAGAIFDVSAIGGYVFRPTQTLAGNGTVEGSVTLSAGATLSPGASPGALTVTGSATLGAGGNYNWQVYDASGTSGSTTGWDLLSVGGALDVAATAVDPFKINLWSLSGVAPDVTGNAINWSATTSGTWRIASATGGITNFAADKFTINVSAANGTGGFSNTLSGGTFSLAQAGNDLNLVFNAAPVTILNVASGTQTQTAAGYPLLSGATPVIKTGAGTLVLDQANTLSGPTTVQEGVLQLASASALSSSRLVVVAGGTGQVAPVTTTSVASLDLSSGNGLLDLTSGALTIASGMTATELVAEILEGRGAGLWTGTSGITSSTASAEVALGIPRAVGWIDNGGGSFTTAYAAPGDTNLDWSIDILDVSNFLAGGKFDTGSPAAWIEGDFNYDGMVDILDATEFITTGLYNAGNYNTAPGLSGGVAAVPEPSVWVLGIVGIGVGATAARRRRQVRCRRTTSHSPSQPPAFWRTEHS